VRALSENENVWRDRRSERRCDKYADMLSTNLVVLEKKMGAQSSSPIDKSLESSSGDCKRFVSVQHFSRDSLITLNASYTRYSFDLLTD